MTNPSRDLSEPHYFYIEDFDNPLKIKTVTDFIGKHFTSKFDREKKLDEKVQNYKKYSKYAFISDNLDPKIIRNLIEKNWYFRKAEAFEYGAQLHLLISYYYTYNVFLHNPFLKYETIQFKLFLSKEGAELELVDVKRPIYDKDLEIACKVPAIFKRKSEEQSNDVIIINWKRCKKNPIYYNQMFDYQINMYKYILEKNSSYNVKEMMLWFVNPETETEYYLVPVAEMRSVTEKMEQRMKFIKNRGLDMPNLYDY